MRYTHGNPHTRGRSSDRSCAKVTGSFKSRTLPATCHFPHRDVRITPVVCDPRVNKRPPVPDCCPPRVVDIMKKCWSPDPFLRPQAKDLDMLFLDMTMQDAEPLSKEHQARTEKATGGMLLRSSLYGWYDKSNTTISCCRTRADMLYQVFPKHIADALKAGEKVEPESHENVTIVLSDIVHFTDISSSISPLKVSSMLDRLYLSFDELAGKHSVFKVSAALATCSLSGRLDAYITCPFLLGRDHWRRVQ